MFKQCQNCQISFEVTEEDLKFYDKVSPVFNNIKYQIPSPTLCPDCRQQRRLCFRNERNLYHRKCDLTGKEIVSNYSPDKPYKIYEQKEWWSDKWDPMIYGKDYNLDKTFIEQFEKLYREIPFINLFYYFSENSDYTNHCYHNKDCYMLFNAAYCENVYYSSNIMIHVKDTVDCMTIEKSELLYECRYCKNCSSSSYLIHCNNCFDSHFLYDCTSCKSCFMCSNLRNKEYCISNKQYTKEEYGKLIQSYEISNSMNYKNLIHQFENNIQNSIIHKNLHIEYSENCLGDYIFNSKNVSKSFYADKCQDIKYCYDALENKDCFDTYESSIKCELQYECYGCNESSNLQFCIISQNSHDLQYCIYCFNCSDCFACIGLRHKKYCILNKQYSKEEYEKIVSKMIQQMHKDNEYGEFFPVLLSPFAYNETIASEYYPMTKEEVLKKQYKWQDNDFKSQYQGMQYKIPNDINDVQNDITKAILSCEISKKPYKIISQELEFYRKMNLPIPRRCPDQRHFDRISMRNSRKLWNRNCDKCEKNIQSTYDPNRPKIVYCEECYLKNIY